MIRRTSALAATLLLLCAAPAAADDAAIALVGGEVRTVSGRVLRPGTVVLRDGRIEAVGAAVDPPAGARVIDCAGKVVTPGLIDADTDLGLSSADRGNTRTTADARAADAVDRWDARLATARREGVTSLLVTGSTQAVTGGAATLVSTAPPPGEVVVERGALVLNLASDRAAGGAWGAGRRADVRKLLVRARHQREQLDRWRRDLEEYERKRLAEKPLDEELLLLPSELLDEMDRWSPRARAGWREAAYKSMGAKYEKPKKTLTPPGRPRTDAQLDALLDAMAAKGDKAARATFFRAELEGDVAAALELAREFGMRPVVAGGAGLLPHAKKLAGARVPVVVTHVADSAHRESGPLARRPDDLMARLVRAKVRPALGSGGAGGRFLRLLAAREIGRGLGDAAALRSVTLSAAEAAGVAERLGSIAAGKRADLVVWTGDPFSVATRTHVVIVGGRVVHE